MPWTICRRRTHVSLHSPAALSASRARLVDLLETAFDGFPFVFESHLLQLETLRLAFVLQTFALATLSLQFRALPLQPEDVRPRTFRFKRGKKPSAERKMGGINAMENGYNETYLLTSSFSLAICSLSLLSAMLSFLNFIFSSLMNLDSRS